MSVFAGELSHFSFLHSLSFLFFLLFFYSFPFLPSLLPPFFLPPLYIRTHLQIRAPRYGQRVSVS